MINILYFASVKERLGVSQESYEIIGATTGEQLLDALADRGEPWQSVLEDKKLLIAINQEMVSWQDEIQDGDEVAFFPPVTGG